MNEVGNGRERRDVTEEGRGGQKLELFDLLVLFASSSSSSPSPPPLYSENGSHGLRFHMLRLYIYMEWSGTVSELMEKLIN